jgi:membrane associated rhomboid family serine protease
MRRDEEPALTEPEPSLRLPRTVVTLALVLVNVAVAVAMTAMGVSMALPSIGALRLFGGVEAGLVWHGEPWRLATAMFVHGGVWHLVLNMWVLLQIGRTLERHIGASRFLLVYLASGIFGFAASTLSHPRMTVGASGAIFGAAGALLALGVLTRHGKMGRFLIGALMPFILGTLALGYLIPFVDNTAHVAGLLCGFLLGYGLCAGERTFLGADDATTKALLTLVTTRERVLGGVSLSVAGALFLVVVPYAVRPIFAPRYHATLAFDALAEGRLDDARVEAARARELGPSDVEPNLVEASLLRVDDPQSPRAVELAKDALLRLDPSPPRALMRALLEAGLLDDSDLGVRDAATTRVLCDGMMAALGAEPAPDMKNLCAWVALVSPDPRAHDAALGLTLATQAVTESSWQTVNIVHTYAVALAENGKPREAQHVLERAIATGAADSAFIARERARFAAAADEADRKAAAVPAP